jgi:endonuclease/exonuclease/phosphatase family metal-dependent hydrolase
MVKILTSVLLGASLLGSATLVTAGEIDVMTQNQYLGADLTPVLGAATAVPFDADAFNAAVVMTLKKVAAARPAERVKALAALIARRNPDAVGLQEAYRFACLPYPGVPDVVGKGCDDPEVRGAFSDQLQDTETALRGKYVLKGRVTNLKVDAIPFAVNGVPAILQVADRDAILVRRGLAASAVAFAPIAPCRVSDQGCNFSTRPDPFPTPLGPIAIERGFLAVDVAVKGQAYRIFNTHLEQRLLAPTLPQTRLLQVGQASELLGTALGTWDGSRKVVVLGDFNSAPGDTIDVPPGAPAVPTPYQVFAFNGFVDAWTMRPQGGDGFSCCQAEDLSNRRLLLYERIDLIFSLTPPRLVLDMRLLGETMGDKTRPPGNGGLWASDHASVAAKLHFD